MARMSQADKAAIKRATFLRRLLKENGLILSAFDPGVLALRKTGFKDHQGKDRCVPLNFDHSEWQWLEPKLLELRRLRRSSTGTKHG